MIWNVVKRLANQNRVNCLFDVIGQSDMLSLYGTEKNICLGHRGLSEMKKARHLVLVAVPRVRLCQLVSQKTTRGECQDLILTFY